MSPAHKPTPKTKKTAQPIAISAKDQQRLNQLLSAGKLDEMQALLTKLEALAQNSEVSTTKMELTKSRWKSNQTNKD